MVYHVKRGAITQPGSAVTLGFWIDRHLGLLLLSPAVIALSIMLVFPIGYTLYYSFHTWFASSTTPPQFVGIKNYVEMWEDVRFVNAILRTLYYAGLAVVGEVILGVGIALLLNKPFAGRGLARTLFLLPMVATPVAIALVWVLMYEPLVGILNYLLSLFHLPTSLWAYDRRTVIQSLVLVDIWHWTPLVMLIVLAGLSTLPTEPYDAARIDGASSIQVFRYITLPLLRPYIVVAALFRGIDALKTFDTIFVITRGGPAFASETLNLYIYSSVFDYLHIGYSSAMLVVFFLIVLGLSLILIAVRRGHQ